MPCPEKFNNTLEQFGVNREIISEINDGYSGIASKSPKKIKGAYFKRALDIMNEKLDSGEVKAIFEANACCKSGAREKNSREFARINKDISLEEKLQKIAKAPYMNMGAPELLADGTILLHAVYAHDGEKFFCACSNYRRLKYDYSVSKNYCYCCGGHFKYHYEIMLGVMLNVKEVVTSPLDSNGANPCAFLLEIVG